MDNKSIEMLYKYGKKVFNNEVDLNKATEDFSKTNGGMEISSIKHYIGLYSKLRSSKPTTFNSNSTLLVYYVTKIAEEEDKQTALNIIETAKECSVSGDSNKFKSRLDEIKNKLIGNQFVCQIQVQRSVLLKGITIPKNKETLVLNLIQPSLQIGSSQRITLIIDNDIVENNISYVRYRSYNRKPSLQIKYSETQSISKIFVEKFKQTYELIKPSLNIDGRRANSLGDISDNQKEYIRIYTTEKPNVLAIKCFPAPVDMSIINEVETFQEDDLEQEISDDKVSEFIEQISKYIKSKGFDYNQNLITNFFLCLKSKPFVLLAGISGTGKSKLVRLFAEAVGATIENGQFALVPVRPDWSDSSDLFGHKDLYGEFKDGAITVFIDNCWKNPEKPYFLCLDEMNLARVEYYFSDFLSVLESRCKNVNGGNDSPIEKKHGVSLKHFPNNLYVIGTVNMDETTFPFSKKVLDRANTIEFATVDLSADNMFNSNEDAETVPIVSLQNDFFKSDYYLLKDIQYLTKDDADIEFVKHYCNELESINKILERANCHVGYRVRDEIIFYMLYNRRFGLLHEKEAFDNSILQKILPRIQGSNSNIKDLLIALFDKYFALGSGYKLVELYQEGNTVSFANCKYRKCAEKIAFMYSRFESDGFTSFWL